MKKPELIAKSNIKRSHIIYLLLCVFVFLGFLLLRISDDDEIEISYHTMEVPDEEYVNNDLGIINVPEGGVVDENNVYARVGEYALQKGTYDLNIVHACPEDSVVKFKSGSKVIHTEVLPGKQSETRLQFRLDEPTDNFLMEFSYPGNENIQLKHISIRSNGLLFTDSVFSGILLMAVFIIPCFYYIKKKRADLSFLCIVFAVFFASAPLLSGQYVGGFDIGFHLMRLEGIRDGLIDGQFPVVIYPNAKSEHGYLGALYPSLFLYIPALLRFLKLSEPAAFNFLLILINAFTGWSMFISMKGITKSEKAALIAAVLYVLMPFRIFNIYTGSEVGALLGMLFFPLAVWGIYEVVLGDHKKWPILTLAFAGLIGSHVLSTLFMTVFCAVFCVIFIRNLFCEIKRIRSLFCAAGWCVFMCLYFLVPFLYYRQGLRYDSVLRDKDPAQYMLSIGELFRVKPVDVLHPSAGPVTLILILIIVMFFSKPEDIPMETEFDKKNYRGMLFFSVAAFFSLIAVTPLFPWNGLKKIDSLWYMIKIIQLPWRFLSIVSVLLCIVSALALIKSNIFSRYVMTAVGMIIILCLISDYAIMDEHKTMALTDDKIVGGWNFDNTDEYTPLNYTSDADMAEDMEYVPDEGILVTDYVKNGTNISFSYSSDADGNVRLPLIYYQGYVAKTASGVGLKISESEIGTISVELPASGGDQVILKHAEPWYLRLAEITSLIVFIAFAFIFFIRNMGHSEKRK